MKLTLIPVLDENNNFLGVITMQNMVQHFSKLTMADNPGGIIILELNINDYSLSEIAQIVESNDTKVLSLYICSHPDSTKMDVTLKVNKTDIAGVLQTFNRYDYTVKASYSADDLTNDLKDRFLSFMNYLNM